jgi:PAS domain S-box-containing protein
VRHFNLSELKLRPFALPPLLMVAVFLVASFCMPFPHSTDGNSSLWLATGVPLAVLLRRPGREWPALVVASVIGNVAASLYSMDETLLLAVSRAGTNAFEYGVSAWVVRRRCGSYFDLTDPRHLAWLAGAASLASLLKVVINFTLIHSLRFHSVLGPVEIISWAPTAISGLFVLSLPILALTSRSAVPEAKLSLSGLILLLVLAGEVALIFGPTAFPAGYIVMPVMMLLGWRHGLLGAGLGAIVTVILSIGLTWANFGILDQFRTAGYGAQVRGSYMALFFIVAILSSLPLAILRARQRATDMNLAEALAAALQARHELGRVIETSIDIICTLDIDGRFTKVSENCFEIWGWRREELLGHLWFDFIHEDDRALAIRNYRLRTQGKLSLPVRYRHVSRNASAVSMYWSMTWVPDDWSCYCVGRDMTEQDELQERAAQAQRMDAIGQLTGGIAHDFNNLLTVILGNCQVLALKLKEPKLGALASMSARAAEQGAALVAQLLAFGRRQPLKPKRFAADELIHSAAPLIARTLDENIELSITCCGNLWPVLADPLQTETALINLCINARDAMPQGGKLLIEAANATVAESDAEKDPPLGPGQYVKISVKDNGEGIPPQIAERIFEPFFTTKEVGKGSGLGLSMVYGFVQQSRGHVGVETEVGKGTMFSLYLPAAPAELMEERPDPDVGTIYSGVGTVLIVEDHELVRVHARDQFEDLGYNVVTAESGSEAISILSRRDGIDLVFTDVVMPGGLSGFDLGKIVQERWPSVRVLYTSGYTQEIVNIADDRLLPKPYSLESLSEKVKTALGV